MADESKNVLLREVTDKNGRVKIAILNYVGTENPNSILDWAVHEYMSGTMHNQYVDINMDNPWVRVLIKGQDEITQKKFEPGKDRL